MMLTNQPFYISGIDDVDTARDNAFGAMIVFAVTFFLSLVGLHHDSRSKREDMDVGEEGYTLNQGSRYD